LSSFPTNFFIFSFKLAGQLCFSYGIILNMSKTAEDLQKELEAARAELEALKNEQKLANEPRVQIGSQVRKSIADNFRDTVAKKDTKLRAAMEEALTDWVKKNQ
jgi:hypothetical protein